MSSILDALKKLELEKAQASQDVALTPVTAEQELISHRTMHERLTIRMSPTTAIAAVAIFSLVLVLLSVGLSAVLLRDPALAKRPAAVKTAAVSPAVQPAAPAPTLPPAPAVIPPAVSRANVDRPPAKTPDKPASAPVETAKAPPAITPPVSDPVPVVKDSDQQPKTAATETEPTKKEPAPAPAPEPVPEPAVETEAKASTTDTPPVPLPPAVQVAKIPAVEESEVKTEALPDWPDLAKAVKPQAEESSTPPIPRHVAPPRDEAEGQPSTEPPVRAAVPQSIKELPILSPGIKMRYGLDKLRVNMVKPISPSNPYGQAVINMIPTYEGDPILNTTAKLIKVESHGVAIEIMSTGDRYYLDF